MTAPVPDTPSVPPKVDPETQGRDHRAGGSHVHGLDRRHLGSLEACDLPDCHEQRRARGCSQQGATRCPRERTCKLWGRSRARAAASGRSRPAHSGASALDRRRIVGGAGFGRGSSSRAGGRGGAATDRRRPHGSSAIRCNGAAGRGSLRVTSAFGRGAATNWRPGQCSASLWSAG
jgi:hypothetical protein